MTNYNIEQTFNFKYDNPVVNKNIIQGDKYRITIINQRLIRFEYNEDNHFTDKPTQVVLNRNFGHQQFKVVESESELEIETEYLIINYNKKEFTGSGLQIIQKKALDQDTIWRFQQPDNKNLKGTCRTLDNVNGRTELIDGIISENGYGIIDDSESLILNKDGLVKERQQTTDIYFFGYGLEYREAIQDFYQLTGNYPQIPKYMLGNWWSRFWEYNDESMKELVTKFSDYKIPLSVFIFDMDWHLVNLDSKYGSGWTGFTWNKELFPDPQKSIKWLHDRGIKTALNLHPSDGFRAFEDDYEAIATDLNLDPSSESPIAFDVADDKFMQSYFNNFIRNNELLGIDFWWLDWQQGDTSKIPGLDPLWMLNHYHYLDHGLNHDNPVIFSRFSKIGSHRYPIGFSGDTHMTWESLAFQPEFTATSANVGYNYWSHDIGGHMLGKWDEELYTRWLQLGVFSPIMRLHSGKTAFIDKEPWENSEETLKIVQKYLQLRTKLMTFIDSENKKGSREGHQLIEPLYYDYPTDKEVYHYKNQYLFGKQLLIAPVVTPKSEEVNLSKTVVYLPSGNWYDAKGHKFMGNQTYNYYTKADEYPVFRKPGSIIPLETETELILNLVCGTGEYLLATKIGEFKITQTITGNKLIVTYPEVVKTEHIVKIKANPAFEITMISEKLVDGNVIYEFTVNEVKQQMTTKELIKLIKDFNLATIEKIKIEDNQYILNDNASNIERITALNSINLTAEQKEVLIAKLS